MLEIVYNPVAAVLLPSTAGRQQAEITAQTLRAARLTLLLTLAVVVPLALSLSIVIPAVYGPSFVGAVPVARLLLAEAAISGMVWVALQAFLALGRPEPPAVLQVVVLVLVVGLLTLVVPRLGAVGAAAGLLAMALLRLALTIGCYRLLLDVAAREFVPSLDDIRYVVALMRRHGGARKD